MIYKGFEIYTRIEGVKVIAWFVIDGEVQEKKGDDLSELIKDIREYIDKLEPNDTV